MNRPFSFSRALLLIGATGALLAAGETATEEPQYEMTTYQFALLLPGPNQRPMGEQEIQRLQEGHLAHYGNLLEQGKAIAFGPLDALGKIRRAVVLAVDSTEEAESILQQDPWVESGKLTAEVHPWWAAKGIFEKPANPLHLEPCYLGLLKRPADAPDYPEEKLREIQAGHMANIQKMADSGDLVIAGPMADDGQLRGIYVFRTLDVERIREMVARDPSIKMGRLGVELYRWHIPKGTLP